MDKRTLRTKTACREGITEDDFLGGKVHLLQEKAGLRATSDSVLAAAAVPAKGGDTVLDVGTGNGAIAMCLNARIPNLQITGLDCQEDVLSLATENARNNRCQWTSVLADIAHRPSPLHGRQFHHVVTNPPYYDEPHVRHLHQQAVAYHQTVSLSDWILFCLRHVRAKGSLTLIHRPEALPDILQVLKGRLGALEVIPILSKENEPAKRVIVRGRMNSRKPLRLLPPIVMHKADGDRGDEAEKILRDGMGLDAVYDGRVHRKSADTKETS